MARQHRKKARGKQPVTQHPLFPGLVALWFGALFGLGSLAIRPSLLESLVLASQIDTLIPAAAPPLGMTARILLALVMASIGGIAGSMIARRIARPKPEPRQRKRQATSVSTQAEARRPISAHEELGERITPATVGATIGGRRRNLAMDEDNGPGYGREHAPLPGGAPQILDVTGFDFAEPAPAPEHADSPLDLGAFADARIEEAPVLAAPMAEAPAASIAAPAASISAVPEQRPFAQPSAPIEDAAPAMPDPASRPFAQPTMRAPVMPEPAPVLPRMASPETAPVAEEPVLELPRLHARPVEPDVEPDPAPAPAVAETQPATPSDAPQISVAITVANIGFPLPEGEAAQRLADTDLETLNQMELIERLALSLLKRRGQTSAVAVAASLVSPSEPVAAETAPVASQPPAKPMYRFGQPGMTEPAFEAEPVAAASEPLLAEAHEAAPETGPETVIVEPAEVAVETPMAMPAAMRPLSFGDDDIDDSDLLPALPPRHIAMPATPAPAMPAAFEAAPEAGDMPQVAAAEYAEVAEGAEEVAEEHYSSLLDLDLAAPQKPSFVRIDEPEEAAAMVEPVVVFPGQAARPFAAPAFAAPATQQLTPSPLAQQASLAEDPTPLRRFDAPGMSQAAAPAAGAAPASAQDPAETEQALRTALAALQRMSGAA